MDKPLNPLSQLDVTAPDHVSVITRDGKVTISVLKDGTSVTLGFPIRSTWLETTPRPPLQQSKPVIVKHERTSSVQTPQAELKRIKELGMRFQSKLTEEKVIEIKKILADPNAMSYFSSKTAAYQKLGEIYGVSGCRIQQIANGKGWNHIKV
jgi:hypothetical protein